MNPTEAVMSDNQTLQPWLDAMVESADELARTAMGLEAVNVRGNRDMSTLDTNGSYLAIIGDDQRFQLAVASTREGCESLAKTLLGADPSDPVSEDDVSDAMGEIINIIAGGVKLRMRDVDPSIQLGLPMFVEGKVHTPRNREIGIVDIDLGDVAVHLIAFRQKK